MRNGQLHMLCYVVVVFRQGKEGREICHHFCFSQLFHPLLQFYVGCMKAFVRLRSKHSIPLAVFS